MVCIAYENGYIYSKQEKVMKGGEYYETPNNHFDINHY